MSYLLVLIHLMNLFDDNNFGNINEVRIVYVYMYDLVIPLIMMMMEQGCFTSHLLSFDNNKVLKIINWTC